MLGAVPNFDAFMLRIAILVGDRWFGTYFIFPYIGNVIIPTDYVLTVLF